MILNKLGSIYNNFDSIKHIDDSGVEYWYARELMIVLEYSLWQNFHGIIKIAINNCDNSNYSISDHFIDINKMVDIGANTKRKIKDYRLSMILAN